MVYSPRKNEAGRWIIWFPEEMVQFARGLPVLVKNGAVDGKNDANERIKDDKKNSFLGNS